jgi:hypothetical protein
VYLNLINPAVRKLGIVVISGVKFLNGRTDAELREDALGVAIICLIFVLQNIIGLIKHITIKVAIVNSAWPCSS